MFSSYPESQFSDDEITPLLSPKESPAPLPRIILVVAFFCTSSIIFAIPLVIVTVILSPKDYSLWGWVILYLQIWGLLAVLGSSAESFSYVWWWLRRKWSTEYDTISGTSEEKYQLPVAHLYAVVFFHVTFVASIQDVTFDDEYEGRSEGEV
ncbi:hypothetical protein GGR53DRAFT_495965 [Hypoxylon sp. FL1150]|nr:hypothetical protein GGR53DRAFT_495965 [Hypoxylon sp. FL1150]